MMTRILTRINIFLFMVWAEILIFVFSFLISIYTLKPFSTTIVEKYGFLKYDAFRIGLTFFYITIFQSFYRSLILNLTKIKINILFSIINSQAISLFFINFIIKKTMISKYPLIFPALFICFLIPFSKDILQLYKSKISQHR